MSNLLAVNEKLTDHADDAVDRLLQFLKIPSISTDPAYTPDVRRCAAWLEDDMLELGLEVEVNSVPGGHPVVVGKTKPEDVANPYAPRVLFYGHYDVQPPDPVDLWTSPPFDPAIRESPSGQAIYARGASDDKGQVRCFLEAMRAYKASGQKWPGPVTVLIEGEEECGSVTLPDFLKRHANWLDVEPNHAICLVSDTCMWESGDAPTPAITYGLRGLVYFDVKLFGPSRDLHSGVYGGTLANPATELARVLGKLIDDDRRVTIPGFYDDVQELTPEERDAWQKLGFDEAAFTGEVDSTPAGETGFSTLERRWTRPSCDVNGLYGGYMGEGAKTVIPTFAGAKVSFRIPANMNPGKVAKQFTDWLQSHDVGGCRWEIENHGEAHPCAVSTDSPFMAAASRAIEAAAGQPPVLVREGATIPVIADFKTQLGIDTLLIGFGLNGDNIHSPDEHMALDRFHLGCHTHAALLAELASVPR